MIKSDKEIEADVDFVLANRERLAKTQRAERLARLNDPANADAVAEATAMLEISRALYNARKAANLTQKELAEQLHTSQSFIARMEQGRVNITIQTIAKYAAACGKKIALI
ncbi:MAG: helix-turn-helix domain-containing protein [Victivallaceae bacterium]